MRGTRRSARLTGVPPESERPAARPPALPRAMSQRSSREGTSRDPRRSFDERRRGADRGGSSEEVREAMDVDQPREESMGMDRSDEGMEESRGGVQASGYGYPPHYPPFPQGPGYPIEGMSDYSSFAPYPM